MVAAHNNAAAILPRVFENPQKVNPERTRVLAAERCVYCFYIRRPPPPELSVSVYAIEQWDKWFFSIRRPVDVKELSSAVTVEVDEHVS
jgi:hypothetical protein